MRTLVSSGVELVRCSRPWRTPAWPDPAEPPFVNGVAELATGLGPCGLMALLHDVEFRFGRVRGRRNAPRSIDLDLIDYRGRRSSGESGPVLPHPRASGRAFVLLPLKEVAPQWRDPVSGASVTQLIAALPHADRSACRPAGGVLCAAAPG